MVTRRDQLLSRDAHFLLLDTWHRWYSVNLDIRYFRYLEYSNLVTLVFEEWKQKKDGNPLNVSNKTAFLVGIRNSLIADRADNAKLMKDQVYTCRVGLSAFGSFACWIF